MIGDVNPGYESPVLAYVTSSPVRGAVRRGSMRAVIVEDISTLAGAWPELVQADPLATPFASFEWASAWCRHWSSAGSPWVLAVYDGSRLAGLAPFTLKRRGGLRFLTGLGVSIGNYWDVIAAPADREPVTAAVAQNLCRHGGEWDALFVDKLPEDSATLLALEGAGMRVAPPQRLLSPRIELPETFDDYLATVSSRRRNEIRRSLRAIESGELSIRALKHPDELRSAVKRWQDLKVQWWTELGRPLDPTHASPGFREFVVDALSAMAVRGMTEVWELLHNGEVAGVVIALVDDHAYYGWLFGFDTRLQKLKPGHLVIAYGIRWSIQTGRRYFDFMLGAESYKSSYAPVERFVLTTTVGNDHLRSRATLELSRLRREALPSGWRIPFFGRERLVNSP